MKYTKQQVAMAIAFAAVAGSLITYYFTNKNNKTMIAALTPVTPPAASSFAGNKLFQGNEKMGVVNGVKTVLVENPGGAVRA